VQKAGTAYQTFKGKDIRSIANQEVQTSSSTQILQASLPGAVYVQVVNAANGQFFPSAPKNPTTGRTVGTAPTSGILGPNSRIGF
jgi:hypothetical protein